MREYFTIYYKKPEPKTHIKGSGFSIPAGDNFPKSSFLLLFFT